MSLLTTGQVYVEVVCFVESSSTKGEVCLFSESGWHQSYVDGRPRRLFDKNMSFRAASVDVLNHPPGPGVKGHDKVASLCWQAMEKVGQKKEILTSLTEYQYGLLNSPVRLLAEMYVADKWPEKCKARPVQLVVSNRAFDLEKVQAPRMIATTFSSDDSDEFQDEDNKYDTSTKTLQNLRARIIPKDQDRPDYSLPLPQIVQMGLPTDKKKERDQGSLKAKQETLTKVLEIFDDEPDFVGSARSILNTLRPLSDFFDVTVGNGEAQSEKSGKRFKKHLKALGCSDFRGLQEEVCATAIEGSEGVIFMAPCGHGKTLTFLVPALEENGITLVVEPQKGKLKSALIMCMLLPLLTHTHRPSPQS